MAIQTQARRRPEGLTDIAAENSKMQIQIHVLYNLLIFCRDTFKIRGGSEVEVHKIEAALKSVKIP